MHFAIALDCVCRLYHNRILFVAHAEPNTYSFRHFFLGGGGDNNANTEVKILDRRETGVGKIKAHGFGNITISPSSLHRPV